MATSVRSRKNSVNSKGSKFGTVDFLARPCSGAPAFSHTKELPTRLPSITPVKRDKYPLFYSSEHLIGADLEDHIDRIYDAMQEKDHFIALFRECFIPETRVDLSTYKATGFMPFSEKSLIKPIIPKPLSSLDDICIAAVDGGLGFRQFFGLQLTLIKASVVNYRFFKERQPEIEYYPARTLCQTPANYCLFTDYSPATEYHGNLLAGYRRAIAENSMLLRFLQSRPRMPELVLLDGSLLPPPFPISAKEDDLSFKYFYQCFDSYNDLYQFCEKNNILLVGSVKDTQIAALRDLLLKALPFFMSHYDHFEGLKTMDFRRILKSFNDSELLYKLLAPKTRSSAFRFDLNEIRPTDTPGDTASRDIVTKMVPKVGLTESFANIYASYLQISPSDMPLRVEFLSPNSADTITRRIDQIASVIYPLASITPNCSIPLPQIEAHQRAFLPESEFNLFLAQIQRHFCLKQLEGNPGIGQSNAGENEGFNTNVKTLFSTFMGKRHSRMPF